MPKKKISFLIPILILAAVFPAATALVYHKLTGDPTMQPLAITFAKLAERSSGEFSSGILVDINWGVDTTSPNTPDQVKAALQTALAGYGIDYLVRVNKTPGDAIRIFFATGSNRFGPFRLSNVSSGIAPAVSAFHMANKSNR